MPKFGTINSSSGDIQTVFEKNIYIEVPSGAEDITWFYTTNAITVTSVHDAIKGTTLVGFGIYHGTTANASGGSLHNVFAADRTADDVTGEVQTLGGDITIPAVSYVRLITSSITGNPTSLFVTMAYTED